MNRVQRALDAAQQRPHQAIAWAREILDDPKAAPDERAAAAWAEGRAHSELNQVDQACTALAAGLTTARDAELRSLAADIGISLAACLLTRGDTDGARAELERAERDLGDLPSRGRWIMQHGFVELHLGHLDAAERLFDEAEPLLRPGVDDQARARLLVNRGMVRSLAGDLDRAAADLRAVRALADDIDQPMLAAGAAQNLGFVADCRGDLPEALSWFDEARRAYSELGSPARVLVTLEIDRATALANAGLHGEAAEAAERAADLARASGNRLADADATLLVARARLANGELQQAEQRADEAAATFDRSQRLPWAAMARYVALQAAARADPGRPALAGRAATIADRLATSGWVREADEAAVFAARTALAGGDRAAARQQLERVARPDRQDPAIRQVVGWLAAALSALVDDDRQQAMTALETGMDVVGTHRASLGATELRASASVMAAELAELGLELAIDDGQSAGVLAWAERWHAGSLQLRPVRPDPASDLARSLVELRRAHARARELHPDGGADQAAADRATDHEAEIARLERTVRDRSRLAPGRGAPDGSATDVEAVCARLGGRALVEYVVVRDRLHAVGCDGAGDRWLVELGPWEPVTTALAHLTAALGRLAWSRAGPRALAATEQAIVHAATELDRRLLRPLPPLQSDDVVIVPTRALQGLPWSVLPTLERRSVTVSPSARLWAAAGDRSGRSRNRVLLVSAPDLYGGADEMARLVAVHPAARVLDGDRARVDDVVAALARSDVAHIAAHGLLRVDNPMFSAVTLADGPLTVYDIEASAELPTTVVLSACDAARSSVRHGDELLGTAAALIQAGVVSVLAPVTVIPDLDVVPPLMETVHRNLAAGADVARAMLEARLAAPDRRSALTAATFVTLGASDTPLTS